MIQSYFDLFVSSCTGFPAEMQDSTCRIYRHDPDIQSQGWAIHASCKQRHAGQTHSSNVAAGFAGLRLNMLAMEGCLRSLNLGMHTEDRAQGECLAGASRSSSSALPKMLSEPRVSWLDIQAAKGLDQSMVERACPLAR